ncbi:hypothetical protein [Caballeronia sp. GAWG1-5s-s]|uniref:hypothetical protein n=1 Tax=Caballeronia sp. GAWG1-5s-s TaxID=2921743 RepID=UPI002027E65C|nr:hypothetical protein [Caballeronia sp. GAWG1-5s-s]
MEAEFDVLYKGCILSPVAIDDGDFYTAMVVVATPDGDRHASGMLGQFPSAMSARQFALAYGMAELDHRELPVPDWPMQMQGRRVAHRVRV